MDGGKLFKSTNYRQLIYCPTTPQNIMIYSKGAIDNGTTGELLGAKKDRDSLIVYSVAQPTSIILKGSGGDETFTSTVVTNKIDIAADLVSKINASTTVYAIAIDNLDGSFITEAKTAGVSYVNAYGRGVSWNNTNYLQGMVNLTTVPLRLNSFAITDIVGGPIIEDSDVTY